ncbi:unnamed protein product [Amoebophrya sp. A120]|nr:unnamed protein product [Amoebophrya sp. A120]|eukprot:GSA120T00005346001.1
MKEVDRDFLPALQALASAHQDATSAAARRKLLESVRSVCKGTMAEAQLPFTDFFPSLPGSTQPERQRIQDALTAFETSRRRFLSESSSPTAHSAKLVHIFEQDWHEEEDQKEGGVDDSTSPLAVPRRTDESPSTDGAHPETIAPSARSRAPTLGKKCDGPEKTAADEWGWDDDDDEAWDDLLPLRENQKKSKSPQAPSAPSAENKAQAKSKSSPSSPISKDHPVIFEETVAKTEEQVKDGDDLLWNELGDESPKITAQESAAPAAPPVVAPASTPAPAPPDALSKPALVQETKSDAGWDWEDDEEAELKFDEPAPQAAVASTASQEVEQEQLQPPPIAASDTAADDTARPASSPASWPDDDEAFADSLPLPVQEDPAPLESSKTREDEAPLSLPPEPAPPVTSMEEDRIGDKKSPASSPSSWPEDFSDAGFATESVAPAVVAAPVEVPSPTVLPAPVVPSEPGAGADVLIEPRKVQQIEEAAAPPAQSSPSWPEDDDDAPFASLYTPAKLPELLPEDAQELQEQSAMPDQDTLQSQPAISPVMSHLPWEQEEQMEASSAGSPSPTRFASMRLPWEQDQQQDDGDDAADSTTPMPPLELAVHPDAGAGAALEVDLTQQLDVAVDRDLQEDPLLLYQLGGEKEITDASTEDLVPSKLPWEVESGGDEDVLVVPPSGEVTTALPAGDLPLAELREVSRSQQPSALGGALAPPKPAGDDDGWDFSDDDEQQLAVGPQEASGEMALAKNHDRDSKNPLAAPDDFSKKTANGTTTRLSCDSENIRESDRIPEMPAERVTEEVEEDSALLLQDVTPTNNLQTAATNFGLDDLLNQTSLDFDNLPTLPPDLGSETQALHFTERTLDQAQQQESAENEKEVQRPAPPQPAASTSETNKAVPASKVSDDLPWDDMFSDDDKNDGPTAIQRVRTSTPSKSSKPGEYLFEDDEVGQVTEAPAPHQQNGEQHQQRIPNSTSQQANGYHSDTTPTPKSPSKDAREFLDRFAENTVHDEVAAIAGVIGDGVAGMMNVFGRTFLGPEDHLQDGTPDFEDVESALQAAVLKLSVLSNNCGDQVRVSLYEQAGVSPFIELLQVVQVLQQCQEYIQPHSQHFARFRQLLFHYLGRTEKRHLQQEHDASQKRKLAADEENNSGATPLGNFLGAQGFFSAIQEQISGAGGSTDKEDDQHDFNLLLREIAVLLRELFYDEILACAPRDCVYMVCLAVQDLPAQNLLYQYCGVTASGLARHALISTGRPSLQAIINAGENESETLNEDDSEAELLCAMLLPYLSDTGDWVQVIRSCAAKAVFPSVKRHLQMQLETRLADPAMDDHVLTYELRKRDFEISAVQAFEQLYGTVGAVAVADNGSGGPGAAGGPRTSVSNLLALAPDARLGRVLEQVGKQQGLSSDDVQDFMTG